MRRIRPFVKPALVFTVMAISFQGNKKSRSKAAVGVILREQEWEH